MIPAHYNIKQYDTHVKQLGLKIQTLNSMLAKMLWVQLQSLGLWKITSKMQMKQQVDQSYRRWLEHSLDIMSEKSYLQCVGDTVLFSESAPLEATAVWNEWKEKSTAWLADPDISAYVRLVSETINSLPRIVTGKVAAVEIIFRRGSFDLVTDIYKNNAISDYFNECLADVLLTYLSQRNQQAKDANIAASPIRILEIGAGTGGTSAVLFKKLAPYAQYITEYTYTDISPSFLVHAKNNYVADNPYLTYKRFDVEKDPVRQKIPADTYDVAIATNVLHATKNIKQTLRNVKIPLHHNGLLLLNEVSDNGGLFSHLTFGLLPGWWLYEDDHLRRPGCPMLSPDTWQQILEEEGYRKVHFPVEQAHDLGLQIIVAESDSAVHVK
jgi:SAM-dependent methyltransferase